jgi:hypothetical protein
MAERGPRVWMECVREVGVRVTLRCYVTFEMVCTLAVSLWASDVI